MKKLLNITSALFFWITSPMVLAGGAMVIAQVPNQDHKFGEIVEIPINIYSLEYEVVSSIGAGGMGEVYRARDTELGREVAIKVLPEELADEPERLLRFEREAKALASLNHPNVGEVCRLATGNFAGGTTRRQ